MGPGRDYAEQHFSPLKAIDVGNAKQLGLAWFFDIDTAHRGQESTPLVVDGVMYLTSAWSKVIALNAKTGAPLWIYDPRVPGKAAINACCDVVNRGAAAWKGRI
jgi:glucose dehydrogenase